MSEEAAETHRGDGDLLSRISTELARRAQKQFGRGPTKSKSYMLDDFLTSSCAAA